MNEETLNAAAFFIKDEEGNIREGGTMEFKRLRGAIQITCKVMKADAVQKMVRTRPPGGIVIVDEFTAGKIELLAGEMDDSIPFASITTAIETLRDRFDVPVIDVPKTTIVAVRPNPAKS